MAPDRTIGSEKARKTFRTECDVPYGDGDREVLDILYPAAEDDGVVLVVESNAHLQPCSVTSCNLHTRWHVASVEVRIHTIFLLFLTRLP